MNEAELKEMKEDRLANFAVVAFLGSLLMGQAWGMWEGSQAQYKAGKAHTKLLIFTVPDYSGLVILTFMAGLLGLSLFLATASMVTPLQGWGLVAARWVKPIMLPILLTSFVLSWLSSALELPRDQWWVTVLFIGGFAMFLFILFGRTLTSLFRFLRQKVRRITGYKPLADAESYGPSNGEPTARPDRVAFFERMRSLSRNSRLPQSGEFWFTLSAVVLAIEVLIVVVLWDWLAGDESGSATIRNVGLVIAGSLAILLATWRAVVADKQASSAQRQTAVAQQGLLNERYQKAAEMLGSDVLSVRIGGIHTLRDLAMERPDQYHVRVMRLLCAFARNPTKGGTDWGELATSRMYSDVPFLMLREDLQAVMDVIRSRSDADVHLEEKEGFSLQLQYADLRGATLHGADLRRAILWGANLSGAYLASTRLDCARLNDARLSDAQFSNEGDDPAKGLTQQQLDEGSGGPEAGPKLTGVLDAATGQPLVWREKPIADEA